MDYLLTQKFNPNKPYDEQIGCIEAFFNGDDPFWAETEFTELTSEDKETVDMINYVLSHCELSPTNKEMLISWRDEGF